MFIWLTLDSGQLQPQEGLQNGKSAAGLADEDNVLLQDFRVLLRFGINLDQVLAGKP